MELLNDEAGEGNLVLVHEVQVLHDLEQFEPLVDSLLVTLAVFEQLDYSVV